MPRDKAFAYEADYSVFGIRPVPPKVGFTYHREVLKLSNLQHVKECLAVAEYSSIDTETTSLECANTDLVTINLSFKVGTNPIESYVAFFHSGYVQSVFADKLDKLPSPKLILEVVKLALGCKYCSMHNRLFDQRVLLLSVDYEKLTDTTTFAEHLKSNEPTEFRLSEYDFANVYDTLCIWFQMDSNVMSGLSLKDLAPTYCGIPMDHFDEAVGEDILKSRPKQLLDYGALDTYATLSIFLLAKGPFSRLCPLLFKLQPAFTTALYSCEQQTQYVNLSVAKELAAKNEEAIEELKTEFYTNYGVINLGSGLQKSRLLSSLGYSTGAYNKPRPDGEQVMKTGTKELEKLVKEGCHPAKLMSQYAKLIKLQSSYYNALINFCELQEDGTYNDVRFHLLEARVPTLRLAAGKYNILRRPYNYFLPMNSQALPKPHTTLRGLDYDPKTYEFKFYSDKEPQLGKYFVEVGDDNNNMRSIFSAPPGYVMIKADYTAEELYLLGGFSGEPAWIDAFTHGNDVHNATARKVFHIPEDQDVSINDRKKAKTANFSMAYALPGSYYTCVTMMGMPEDEAQQFEKTYREGLPVLYGWKNRIYQTARVQGYIQNPMGHIRQLRRYYETRSKHYIDYAAKTSVSEMIQGTAGIIMRLDMVKLWKKIYGPNRIYNKHCKNPYLGWRDNADVYYFWSVHDEIVLVCKKELAVEVSHMLSELMESSTPPGLPLKLRAEPEVGTDLGHLCAMHYETIDGVEYLIPDEKKRPSVSEVKLEEKELPEIEMEDDTEELGGFDF